jgi:hypothetical protein
MLKKMFIDNFKYISKLDKKFPIYEFFIKDSQYFLEVKHKYNCDEKILDKIYINLDEYSDNSKENEI